MSIRIQDASAKDGICSGVLAIGIPAALGTMLMSISQVITNAQMASYGDLAVAAYGVSTKIIMLVAMVGLDVGTACSRCTITFPGSFLISQAVKKTKFFLPSFLKTDKKYHLV